MNDTELSWHPVAPHESPHADWSTWRDIDPCCTPAISVILPAGDDDDDLVRRVPDVLDQSVCPHEVMIVDTSHDGRHFATVARLEPRTRDTVVRYVHYPLVTRAALRRLVDRLMAGNIVAFAWGGSIVPPGWIERIAESVQRLRRVAIARA